MAVEGVKHQWVADDEELLELFQEDGSGTIDLFCYGNECTSRVTLVAQQEKSTFDDKCSLGPSDEWKDEFKNKNKKANGSKPVIHRWTVAAEDVSSVCTSPDGAHIGLRCSGCDNFVMLASNLDGTKFIVKKCPLVADIPFAQKEEEEHLEACPISRRKRMREGGGSPKIARQLFKDAEVIE